VENPAPTDRPINDLLSRRWSPKLFADRPIDDSTLATLLEAARWAASSFNEQPWSYIVARKSDGPEFDRMVSTLAEKNQQWARSAPLLMISIARNSFSRNGTPNRHAFHDVGAASADLTTQATSMDLFVHQMAGIDRQKIQREYALPEGEEPVAALAVGYAPDPATLTEEQRAAEKKSRTRKPVRDFVFSKTWGSPTPIAP
jgi:nitroreductase